MTRALAAASLFGLSVEMRIGMGVGWSGVGGVQVHGEELFSPGPLWDNLSGG